MIKVEIENFNIDELTENQVFIKRENDHPYYWIARDHRGGQFDRDKYQNDLIPRLEGWGFEVIKVGD